MSSRQNQFPFLLLNLFSHLGRVTICGAGQVFQNKIRLAMEHLGLRNFMIYDPFCTDIGLLSTLEQTASDVPVFILSPNNCHLEQALACLDRGLDLYLEKPIVINSEEVLILTEALKCHQKSSLYCGDYYLFKAWPLISFFRQSVEAPWLHGDWNNFTFGNVIRVEGRLHEGGSVPCGFIGHRHWLSEPSSGGGMLLDLMVHLTNIVEILEFHMTDVDNCQLFSNTHQEIGQFQPLNYPDICEDMAVVHGRLNQTIPFVFSVSKYALTHDRWLRFYDHVGRTATMIFASENTLELDAQNGSDLVRVKLTIDPYLLTLLDAFKFFQKSLRSEQGAYFKQQAASILNIEKMKIAYWNHYTGE